MKQPKRLTFEQKKAVSAAGLSAKNWMLVGQTEFYLNIVNKTSGKTRRIDRHAIPKKGERIGRNNFVIKQVSDMCASEHGKRNGKIAPVD